MVWILLFIRILGLMGFHHPLATLQTQITRRKWLIGFGLKFWEKIWCERVNPLNLSHTFFSRYSILLHTIETRCAGILSKTGAKVCACLHKSEAQAGGIFDTVLVGEVSTMRLIEWEAATSKQACHCKAGAERAICRWISRPCSRTPQKSASKF